MSDDGAIVLRMTDAARTLLDSLSEEQRQLAQWDFPSNEERQRWFYTPTDHGGLTFSDMRPAQHRHVEEKTRNGILRIDGRPIDGRPSFAKRSIDDSKQVKIAAIDPDFKSRPQPWSLMEYAGRHLITLTSFSLCA